MDTDALYEAAIAGDDVAIARLEREVDTLNKYEESIVHIESGNAERLRFILKEFADKNLLVKRNKYGCTALHAAVCSGETTVVEVLIDAARNLLSSSDDDDSTDDHPVTSFQAFLRQTDYTEILTALHVAVKEGMVDIVKLLIEADPSDPQISNREGESPIYTAVEKGYTDIIKVLCTNCKAPSLDGPYGRNALLAAIKNGNYGTEVVEVLINAARHLPSFEASSSSDNDSTDDNQVTSFQALLRRVDKDLNTALHLAVMQGNLATAKLLVEADPSGVGTKNNNGETPFYTAVERGCTDIVKLMCTTCTTPVYLDGPGGGMTALHAVIKNLDEAKNEVRDVIKMIIDVLKQMIREQMIQEYEDLDEYKIYKALGVYIYCRVDQQGRSVIEVAVERNYLEVVELLLDLKNPAYKDDWMRHDFISLMPLIYKAREKEYKNMVQLLTERYEAGAKVMTGCTIHAKLIAAITNHETESISELFEDHAEDLVNFSDLGWTALHHAAYHEFNSMIYSIVKKQKKYGHTFVYEDMQSTPFHVAAEKGYTSTVKLLFQLWPSGSSAYTEVDRNGQNILHLAALQSKKEMIQDILKYCSQKYKIVNQQDMNGNTPLHFLIKSGCFVAQIIGYEDLDLTAENKEKWTPADMLYFDNEIIDDQVQIKMALDRVQIDHKRDIFSSSVLSSKRERKDVIFKKQANFMIYEKHAMMKEDTHAFANCFADAIAGDPISKAAMEMESDRLIQEGKTILHVESMRGDTERVRYIVNELGKKNLLVKLDTLKQTALHLAAHHGHTQVVEILIDAAVNNLPSSSAKEDTHNPVGSFQDFIRQATGQMGNTALHLAVLKGNVAIVKLLVDADPNDNHVPNSDGKTPIYIAGEKGYKDIVKEFCRTCTALSLDGPGGRTTALHALIQSISPGGASDVIKMMVDAAKRWSNSADFEALFSRTDESESTVLDLAMESNNVDAVRLILQEDPAYQHGREIKTNGLMHLIFKAIDNKYSNDIIKSLSQTYEAGIINPDHKDVLPLVLAMKSRDEDCVLRLLGGARNLVTFTEDNGWTPLHYAVYHEFDSILGSIIEAQEDVGHPFLYGNMVPTPFHIAVKCGYTSTLVLLMQLWPDTSSEFIAVNSPYIAIDENGQNILHLAAADNRKEMVKGILKYCPDRYKDMILKQQDTRGDTPLHLLISHGCFIPELINHKGLDTMAKNNNHFTPRDMLYFKNEIVADQVHIKIALDDVRSRLINHSLGSFGLNARRRKQISGEV